MKYVFNGAASEMLKSLIISTSLLNFIEKNRKDTSIKYSIAGTYKASSGVSYVESISVNMNDMGATKRFDLNPPEFFSIEKWNLLFKPEDQFINETICNKRYQLRNRDINEKYLVTVGVVQRLFTRNSVWKLATYGINSKDNAKKPTVIPLSVKNGRIIRLAIIKPGCYISEIIEYNDNRSPSIKGFLDIYKEVDDKVEFLTENTAARIIEMAKNVEDLRTQGIGGGIGYNSYKESFVQFIKGLVK